MGGDYAVLVSSCTGALMCAYAALDRLPPVVGVPCGVPVDSDKHIYTGWEVKMEKRGGHSDKENPFLHPVNANSTVEYSLDMLPRTLDILERTVKVPLNPDWTQEQADALVAAIHQAAA